MDSLIIAANSGACAGLALLLTWAVFTRRVRDGIVIKVGLIATALGLGATAMMLADAGLCIDSTALERARLVVHAGLGLVLAGYWRHRRAGRTICDLVDLRS